LPPPDTSPRSLSLRWVLTLHVLAVTLTQSTWMAGTVILPLLARREFGATNVEMSIVTMAPLVLASLSIFWGALLARLTIWRYALVYWAVSMLPLMAMHWMTNIHHLLILQVIASIGVGGWSAVNGDLLKRLYPETRRGLAFGLLTGGSVAGGALLSFLIGKTLAIDHESFTWILPGLAVLHLLGVLVVGLLARLTGVERPGIRPPGEWSPARMIGPILHMNRVLREDRIFFRYEAAFMTYGMGWMICWALVPLIITDKLKLPYDLASESTAVPMQLAILLMTLPAGLLSDRIGPIRISSVAFAIYALYPLLLIGTVLLASLTPTALTGSLVIPASASDESSLLPLMFIAPWALTIASLVHGVASAAANMGWLLGPVKLAPTPEKAPQYVAIHATLVGVRGAIFQALGIALYALTGSFWLPLLFAAAGFAWAAWQMRSLAFLIESREKLAAASSPSSPTSFLERAEPVSRASSSPVPLVADPPTGPS